MAKTFIVERLQSSGQLERTELEADYGEQEGGGSTRVTFYIGEGEAKEAVGSFINTQGWYVKPAEA